MNRRSAVVQAGGDEAGVFRTREYLGVTLDLQRRWSSTREAMNSWRDLVESVGVFVFKRSFDQAAISGFCVADDTFPIIVINNSASFTRQIFTLVHELGHLLFGISSITSDGFGLAERLEGDARNLEIACNRFAAEMLVPNESFPWNQFRADSLDTFLRETASRYSVSREVILRRLLDRGLIEQATYHEYVRAWTREGEGRGESGGGNYYATQAAYLGRSFLNLAFAQYRAGNVSIGELAEHLRIKAKNIGKLETFILEHP